jgi:hypothetical protein
MLLPNASPDSPQLLQQTKTGITTKLLVLRLHCHNRLRCLDHKLPPTWGGYLRAEGKKKELGII